MLVLSAVLSEGRANCEKSIRVVPKPGTEHAMQKTRPRRSLGKDAAAPEAEGVKISIIISGDRAVGGFVGSSSPRRCSKKETAQLMGYRSTRSPDGLVAFFVLPAPVHQFCRRRSTEHQRRIETMLASRVGSSTRRRIAGCAHA